MLVLGAGYPRLHKYMHPLREEPTRIPSLGCRERGGAGGGGGELNEIGQLCTWFLSQCVVKDSAALPLNGCVIWKVSSLSMPKFPFICSVGIC